ncbi:MAG: hypothetical protein C0616_03305 [Desulfuromonas sp.]|nr:MAG: hypothetical protein C0616_03305 [Desulfuromonas sp.]
MPLFFRTHTLLFLIAIALLHPINCGARVVVPPPGPLPSATLQKSWILPSELFKSDPAVCSEEELVPPLTATSQIVGQGDLDAPDPTDGLLLWYDFTIPPIDNQITDLSGNAHTARSHGTDWTGRNGLYFNGKDAFVEVQGGSEIHSGRQLTVIGEILPTGYANRAWQALVWKGEGPDCSRGCSNREFSLWLNVGAFIHATSTPRDKVGRGQDVLNSHTGSAMGNTVFAQVIDSDLQSMRVYLHGMEAASREFSSAGIRRSTGPLLIGGGEPLEKENYFQGYMRWLRIYDRALSGEEIAVLSKRERADDAAPWRDPYLPDDTRVRGGWAQAISINHRADTAALDQKSPGRDQQGGEGWHVYPDDWQQTELIFRHDGSPLRLSGRAAILGCDNACLNGSGEVAQIIMGDDRELWSSGVIGRGDDGQDFEVDLSGVNEVRLVTDNIGKSMGEDGGAWLDLELTEPEPREPEPTVQVVKADRSSSSTLEIIGSSTKVGRVDVVYTLDQKPTGNQPIGLSEFPGETGEVYVWFLYRDFEPGDVLTGVWADAELDLPLGQVPVMVAGSQGTAGFSLPRPVVGWEGGHFRVEIKKGEKLLNSTEFVFTD